jgi:thiamine pyrophosphokinase
VTEAVIVANGRGRLGAAHAGAPFIVCADGGADRARRAGWRPHAVIGDLDSATPDTVRWARAAGAEIVQRPRDKDQTDAELAVDLVAVRGHLRASMFCGLGGRVDHLFANLLLPRYAASRGVDLRLRDAGLVVQYVRGRAALEARAGDWVSLFSLAPRSRGITTNGLRFSLQDADLPMGISLGVSNEATTAEPVVEVVEGELIAIQVRRPRPRRANR